MSRERPPVIAGTFLLLMGLAVALPLPLERAPTPCAAVQAQMTEIAMEALRDAQSRGVLPPETASGQAEISDAIRLSAGLDEMSFAQCTALFWVNVLAPRPSP
jgi:hypothetical protein